MVSPQRGRALAVMVVMVAVGVGLGRLQVASFIVGVMAGLVAAEAALLLQLALPQACPAQVGSAQPEVLADLTTLQAHLINLLLG